MSLPPGATLVSGTVPEDQNGLPPGATLVSGTLPNQTPPAKEQPGFFKRLGQSIGVPTSMEELKAATPQLTAGGIAKEALGPIVPAAEGTINYGQRLYQNAKDRFNEMREAASNIAAGQPVLPNIGKAGSAMLKSEVEGLPFIGEPTQRAGEDVAAGNYAGAAGGLTGVVGQLALPKLLEAKLPELPGEESHSLMTRAVKPGKNNIGWDADIKNAMPNLKAAETDLGRPVQNIDDAVQAATTAKKKIWQQYTDKLTQAGKLQPGGEIPTIDGNQIADAMENSLDKRTALQRPDLVAKVKAVADTYRRPLELKEAEDFLQSTNNDLHNYYAKNKVGQRVAQADPEMAYTVAEGNALRSSLYSKLDELTGPGAADLKKQYGALTNVENEMIGRKNVAARQQPASLSEQLGTIHGYGKMVKGALTMNPAEVVSGAAEKMTANWLKERSTTDAMIERAFKNYQAPAATPPVRTTPFQGPAPPGNLPGAPSAAEAYLRSLGGGGPEVEVSGGAGPRQNASGQPGGGGLEEQARMQAENTAGVKYFREDPGGNRTPLTGLGRQDLRAGPGQRILRVDANGQETVLDAQPIRTRTIRPLRVQPG